MTKRGRLVAIGGAAIVGIVLLVFALPRARERAAREAAHDRTAASSRSRDRASQASLATGTLRGSVRASGDAPVGAPAIDGAPIAGARVCATDRDNAATCATTDAAGAFSLELASGAYAVTASAPTFRPSPRAERVWVGASDIVTRDLVLVAGAVKLEGTVSDISGGAIPHASVQAAAVTSRRTEAPVWLPAVEADASGQFTMWVPPGGARLHAVADGYADIDIDANAPGRIAILMTPEASIEGLVVDERGAPVEGARISASWVDVHRPARTDASGRFVVTRLVPARYDIEVHTDDAYGRSAGSVLVALGARADAGTIVLGPATRVSGRVMVDGAPCANARVKLVDQVREREVVLVAGPDAIVRGDGVRLGSYGVHSQCDGAYSPATHPRLVVGTTDLTNLQWRMTRGGSVRGIVRTSDGAPAERVDVTVRWEGGYASSSTGPDGRFELAGIEPGERELRATSDREAVATATVTIVAAQTIEQDLVLDAAAEIRGIVVDTQGRPVGDVDVRAVGVQNKRGSNDPGDIDTTGPDGRFVLHVRPGAFDVSADRGMADHISKVERAIVEAGDSVDVTLVVPPQTGVIRGRVVDAANAPVPDAYVTAYISDGITSGWRWSFEDHPVLTAADGTFVIENLGAGSYTVEATRRGGGETKAVGVEIGANLTLVIAATGSIRGVVTNSDGSHPTEMHITVRDEGSFYRAERFYRTSGAFTLDDLVPGTLALAVVTDEGFGSASVTLAAGEARANVTIQLERMQTLRGRLLDARSRAPLAEVAVVPKTQRARLGSVIDRDDPTRWSGPDGRFAILAFPGPNELSVYGGLDSRIVDRVRAYCRPPISLVLSGPHDMGDVLVVTTREGDRGDLGFSIEGATIVSVTPTGPAARAGLRKGDTLRAIDGVSIEDDLRPCATQLLVTPAGTEVALTLARATIRVTAE